MTWDYAPMTFLTGRKRNCTFLGVRLNVFVPPNSYIAAPSSKTTVLGGGTFGR